MRFKFKPQTGLLVAGLLAASYSEACYYQGTSAVCIASGATVDGITWNSNTGAGQQPITASQDWIVYAQANHHVVWSGTGAGGYQGTGGDGGTLPNYCVGPVHFTDASGNTSSFASWSYGEIFGDPPTAPGDHGIYAGTVDPSSGTCS